MKLIMKILFIISIITTLRTTSMVNGEKNRPSEVCKGKPSGTILKHPLGCKHFIMCSNDVANTGFCPEGTLFSQKKPPCDLAANVDCDNGEIRPTTTTTATQIDEETLATDATSTEPIPPIATTSTLETSTVTSTTRRRRTKTTSTTSTVEVTTTTPILTMPPTEENTEPTTRATTTRRRKTRTTKLTTPSPEEEEEEITSTLVASSTTRPRPTRTRTTRKTTTTQSTATVSLNTTTPSTSTLPFGPLERGIKCPDHENTDNVTFVASNFDCSKYTIIPSLEIFSIEIYFSIQLLFLSLLKGITFAITVNRCQ